MKNPVYHSLIICLIFMSLSVYSTANVTVPVIISNGMVLQRDTKLKIWGWASPGERVNVKFDRKTFGTVTDSNGNWKITLPEMKAGGPHTITGLRECYGTRVKQIRVGHMNIKDCCLH